MTKKIFAVMDTETVGEMRAPYLNAFDVGGVIIDRKGNLIDRINIVVLENFDIENAFYGKRKVEIYRNLIKDDNVLIAYNEKEALAMLDEWYSLNGVTTVCAFNSGFDFGRTLLKYQLDDFEFIDIWGAFVETIASMKKYIDFCTENNYLTKGGSIQTNAEVAYRFLTQDIDFVESHTALDDAIIESEILKAIWQTHKKFTRNKHKINPPQS